ncbi:hypothetical protein IA806_02555 [Listeria seeligeri]|uniref:P-loop ATPase, Sll1717 family n=1 Tax=Listeria seeligeri TaxID=1640 RepID=UPI001887EB4D|nr:hypothetical protein [Listeria seeligeri]MBF2345445.1 hypothetical protein [Listeria seeligeri]
MQPHLSEIFLGEPNGEKEANEKNFMEFFYDDNEKVKKILFGEEFIISGRKGMGKTILSKYVENKLKTNRKYHTKVIYTDNFLELKLKDFYNKDISDEELSLFWKWTFLYSIATVLKEGYTKNRLNYVRIKPYKKLCKFLRDNDIDKVVKVKELSKSSNMGVGIKASSLPNASASTNFSDGHSVSFIRKSYHEKISELELLVFACLKNFSVFIFFEDIDEFQSKLFRGATDNENFSFLILSMLEEVKKLNEKMRQCNENKSKINVLIRDDLIDNIHRYSSNSNKLTAGYTTNLSWISKAHKPWEHPLSEMLLKKIKSGSMYYSSKTNKEVYNELFPDRIYKRTAIKFFLENSFGRPRDVIEYLNLIKKEFPNEKAFKYKMITETLPMFSDYFYRELQNEIRIQEDNLLIHSGLTFLEEFNKSTFYYDDLFDFYKENKNQYMDISDEGVLKDMLNALYRMNVIGNSWKTKEGIVRGFWYNQTKNKHLDFNRMIVLHFALVPSIRKRNI